MRYDLRLRIGYRYERAVDNARHVLRIAPRADRGQSVERLRIDVSPNAGESFEEQDFFANRVRHLRLTEPHRRFAIEMNARVGVHRADHGAGEAQPLAAIAREACLARVAGAASPMHHLGPSRLVALNREAAAFAAALPGWSTLPGERAALALVRAVQESFAYRSGTSAISTGVAEIMAQRAGVCQDFAHVMIAALRGHGVPAAYVSGFIRTEPPPGQPRLEGADAMHAWVDVWLGADLGWVGFDPTNGCRVVDDHVIVALGRDYADVAPVDGVLQTAGTQEGWHAVDIHPLPD